MNEEQVEEQMEFRHFGPSTVTWVPDQINNG